MTHDMTTAPDGRIHCSCGGVSPRIATATLRQRWISHHRRTVRASLVARTVEKGDVSR